MNTVIEIFQRRDSAGVLWSTIGLGAATVTRRGRNETKLRQLVTQELESFARDASPHALRALGAPRTITLEKPRLELTIETPRGRAKKTGLFPVIVEMRRLEGKARLSVAYHPLRQNEVLTLDPDAPLEGQLTPFFGRAWGALDGAMIEALVLQPRDALRSLPMVLRPRSLLDRAGKQKGPFDDLLTEADRARRQGGQGSLAVLHQVGVDLSARAADESLELGRPREPLRTELQQLLCTPKKRSFVLLGSPGAGKRTALRRAVADLLEADGYATHRNLDRVTRVFSVAGSRLLAGMRHVGDWELRCMEILSAARGRALVLLVDDLHTFGRVGRSRDSERCMADVFRGPVQRGEITLVGACTPTQWQRLEDDAPSFAAAFGRVHVAPATEDETLKMLLHEGRRIETSARIRFAPAAYRTILELGSPLFPEQALPGKALDLLRRFDAPVVDGDAVSSLLTQRTGLPDGLLHADEPLDLRDVVADLEEEVLGQSAAVAAVAELALKIRTGLVDPKRPYGTFLFTGPTGTGKTQLAKTLARTLYGASDRLVRFDMGELSGPDAVPRLIGDRWQPRGLLTEAVRQRPFALLLLDEIEKAHPSVLYLLLQLLDDGRLTDAAGDRVSFTHCVVVMTSNLGASPRPPVGFGAPSATSRAAEVSRAVKDFFPPELFNRIDRVVPFEPLSAETARDIAARELAALLGRRGLTDRNVFVVPHESAVDRMAGEAFDERAGARSVRRYLETHVASLLAEHLAGGSGADASEGPITRPDLEVIQLYAREGSARYTLHSDALREATPLPGESPLRSLLDAGLPELEGYLPRALARFDEAASDARMEAIGERVRERLERLRGTSSEAEGDALYRLDRLRVEVDRARARLERLAHGDQHRHEAELELATEGYGHAPVFDGRRVRVRMLDRRLMRAGDAPPRRAALLEAFAHAAHLARAITSIADAGRGGGDRVQVELLRVGRARDHLGLFATLARRYAELAELERAAGVDALGAPVTGSLDELARASLLVMEVSAVDVGALLAFDEGCHVMSNADGGSEIVRVRLHDVALDVDLRVAAHQRDRATFEARLAAGETLEAPDGLAPVVRRYRVDGRRSGRAAYEVEDHRLTHVASAESADLAAMLRPFTWLASSWEAGR
ncbi:MAG: ATP-dependent Clp protease ATP-binding subunit [Myxococcales bacterium]|nr:ATP-dependent Clp protease ATP-binding subunit [Myxococcales bacterium]